MIKKNWENIALFLLVISGLFWGSIGVFEFDVMEYFMDPCWFTRLTYFAFGVSAVYILAKWRLVKRLKR